MTERVQGPASYVPSIEKTYGRPMSDWFAVLDGHRDLAHMEMVALLKTEYGMGHGHANAIVAYYRKQNGL